MSKFKAEKKADNYFIVKHNGEMVVQVMEGGMFGPGVHVIDNTGSVKTVGSAEEAHQVINRACSNYLHRRNQTSHREYVKAALIAAHFERVRRRGY